MKLLNRIFKKQKPKTKYQEMLTLRVLVDKKEDIEFIYYAPSNAGAGYNEARTWLNNQVASGAINANVSFGYGQINNIYGIKAVTTTPIHTERLIPEDRVLLVTNGVLEVLEPKILKIFYKDVLKK